MNIMLLLCYSSVMIFAKQEEKTASAGRQPFLMCSVEGLRAYRVQRKSSTMRRLKTAFLTTMLVGFVSLSVSAQSANTGASPARTDAQLGALSRKAAAGETRAQLQLGLAFEFGQGVDKNIGEAMRWYRMAADSGDPVAQTDLAYLYEIGANGEPSPEEAAKWYLRAAVTGFARAQFNLGTLYLRGAGVEKSEEDGAHWISEAADAGCPAAEAAMGSLYASGRGVPRDEQKARELTEKAAKTSDPTSCTRFGPEASRALPFH